MNGHSLEIFDRIEEENCRTKLVETSDKRKKDCPTSRRALAGQRHHIFRITKKIIVTWSNGIPQYTIDVKSNNPNRSRNQTKDAQYLEYKKDKHYCYYFHVGECMLTIIAILKAASFIT